MSMNYDEEAASKMYDSLGKQQAKQIANQYKLGKDEIKARLKIASQSSKDTRYGIDMERDAARERVAQMREEMERIGIPDMEIRRYVAEASATIAREELALKREIFLAESGLARDQLNKDIAEMEKIGIPRVEIEKYVAQKNYEIQRAQTSGYMQQGGQLTAQQQARLGQLQARDAQLKATGQPGIGAESPQAEQEMFELLDMQSGIRANPATGTGGGGRGQRTLEGEELDRRYGLDVAQFGAELASTPDTYFQARRFQGVDIPRLMGGAGAATTEPTGGPTPGVATMGAYLSGQDPYAQAGGGAVTGQTVYAGGPGPVEGDPNAAAYKAGGGTVYAGGPGPVEANPNAAAYKAGGGTVYAGGPGPVEANPNAAAAKVAAGGYTPSGNYGGSAVTGTGGTMNAGYQQMGGGSGVDDRANPGTYGPWSGPGLDAFGAPTAADDRANPGSYGAGPITGGFGAQGGVDDRHKTVAGIAKLSPPSPYDGLNEQDTSTLQLIENIYKKGGQSIAGGEYERAKASGRLGIMRSAGRILGYDPAELESQYQAYRPAQSDARLA